MKNIPARIATATSRDAIHLYASNVNDPQRAFFMTATVDALFGDLRRTGTATATTAATGGRSAAFTIGQILDLYIVHLIMTVVFVFAGTVLLVEYSRNKVGSYTAWDDLFFTVGTLTLVMNAVFIVGAVISFITSEFKFLAREDDRGHWLHGLSIFAALMSIIWGVLALILIFGSALVGTTINDFEAVSYFIMMIVIVYETFLVVRWLTGFAGVKPPAAAAVQPPTTVDAAGYLAQFRSLGSGSAALGTAAAQPIFGGGGGAAAAFGGLDLSAFQPSSLSTMAPSQYSGGGGGMQQGMGAGGCGVPMIIMPQMMPQQACAAQDPDAIRM